MPEPLGVGGPDLHYFFLGDNAFALMLWMVKLYPTHKGRKNSQLQDLQRQEGSRKHLWNSSEQVHKLPLEKLQPKICKNVPLKSLNL